MTPYVNIGKLADFPEGVMRPFAVLGDQVAVLRCGNDFHAFSNYCTHEAVSFTDGYGVVGEDHVICMLHGSVFDIASGQALQGPAYDPLTIYEVKVQGDEVLIGRR